MMDDLFILIIYAFGLCVAFVIISIIAERMDW
jgi:hypothetical protein